MNCSGYSEFRIRFKLYLEQEEKLLLTSGASEIMSFFKSIHNDEFEELITRTAEQIAEAERIIFVGAGTSGTLGKYGARFSLT